MNYGSSLSSWGCSVGARGSTAHLVQLEGPGRGWFPRSSRLWVVGMSMWGWECMGRETGMGETCEGTEESGAPHVHRPQGVHGALMGSPPSKALSQVFALRAFKLWDVFLTTKTESAEFRGSLESGLIPPPDTWRVSGKATLQMHESWSKGCYAFIWLFWVTGSSQRKKNHPCPSPPVPWALHIRGLRLLCGLGVGSHPWRIHRLCCLSG